VSIFFRTQQNNGPGVHRHFVGAVCCCYRPGNSDAGRVLLEVLERLCHGCLSRRVLDLVFHAHVGLGCARTYPVGSVLFANPRDELCSSRVRPLSVIVTPGISAVGRVLLEVPRDELRSSRVCYLPVNLPVGIVRVWPCLPLWLWQQQLGDIRGSPCR